jgi:hypothetical protein
MYDSTLLLEDVGVVPRDSSIPRLDVVQGIGLEQVPEVVYSVMEDTEYVNSDPSDYENESRAQLSDAECESLINLINQSHLTDKKVPEVNGKKEVDKMDRREKEEHGTPLDVARDRDKDREGRESAESDLGDVTGASLEMHVPIVMGPKA